MEVNVEVLYTIKVTKDEYRLLALGLAGKLAGKQDVHEARILNERLSSLRFNELKAQLKAAEDALAGAQISNSSLVVEPFPEP